MQPFIARIQGVFFTAVLALVGPLGCDQKSARADQGPSPAAQQEAATLTLGAYTTPREAYGKAILPSFQKKWRAESGQEVTFNESYLGSGAQSRAILGGFEADVAALSLEPDIERLREAGLVQGDWKRGRYGGMVTRSVVVIGVRRGNPLGIHGWEDLASKQVAVLTPNVRTSGGAMWNILAIYGAALRGQAGVAARDQAAAVELLGSILAKVKIMDRGARESLLTFEGGVGDAIITYENEILLGKKQGKDYDFIIPRSTILIENPVALVNRSVDRHGTHRAAQAFLDFLVSPEAQDTFVEFGFRPVLESTAKASAQKFGAVQDLFTIADLGGWAEVQRSIFAVGGIYDRAIEQGGAQR